jgi:NAD(P)-dependent dehydrogenase (short-subunit alcohol dehydrogenase family)
MTRFAEQVALVTGGASGIGAAITQQLLKEGARVVVADLNPGNLDEGGDAQLMALTADVTDEVAVQGAVEAAVSHFGRLDLAFNVAGLAHVGTILDGASDDWSKTVEVILKGTYFGTRHAARAMRDGGRGGAIVNVSSLNAHVPMFGGSAYASAKAGTESFTRNAALELAPHRIRVNAVLPGLVQTPLTAPLLENAELKADYLDRIPVGRPATPEEIADPCLYLADDGARYITGASLVVDGGWEITNYPDLSRYL